MRVDPNYLSNLSSAVSSSSLTEQRLTSELSSGLRVGRLSDDPVAASSNVLLSSSISRADTFVQTATAEQGRLQASDSTLGEVVTQVTKAISLATEAGNGTLNAANLGAVAKQISEIRDGVVALANTSYGGTYLFGGSQGQAAPFSLDQTTDPATTTYNGDNVAQKLVTSEGQTISFSSSGASLFQNGEGDLLGSLNQLVSGLNAGNTSGISSATTALSAGLAQVSNGRAALDSSLSALTSASGYASTQESLLKAQQSSLLSADTAEVATDLQTSEVQHQALLSVVAGLGKTDLFDYLK